MRESERERVGKRKESERGGGGGRGGWRGNGGGSIKGGWEGGRVEVVDSGTGEGGGEENEHTYADWRWNKCINVCVPGPLCASPRLPPPLFTGPLARPDLCHHHPPPPPHINTSPCTTAKAGNGAEPEPRPGSEGRERERERGRVSSSQPTHANKYPALHFPNIALLRGNCLGSAHWTERLPFFQAESCPRRESRACSAPPTRG